MKSLSLLFAVFAASAFAACSSESNLCDSLCDKLVNKCKLIKDAAECMSSCGEYVQTPAFKTADCGVIYNNLIDCVIVNTTCAEMSNLISGVSDDFDIPAACFSIATTFYESCSGDAIEPDGDVDADSREGDSQYAIACRDDSDCPYGMGCGAQSVCVQSSK